VCPDGGLVEVQIQFLRGAGTILVRLHAQCTNSCVTDNLEPFVGVTVFDTAGNEVTRLEKEIPKVPARGFAFPTSRQVDHEVELHQSFEVGRIRFEINNQAHGSAFITLMEVLAPIGL
jgi:hypothetical protein